MSSSVIIILTCAGTLLIAWIACFAYRIRKKTFVKQDLHLDLSDEWLGLIFFSGNKSRASDPFQDQITSRSRIYQSRDSQNPAEICRLQTVSEESEKWEWPPIIFWWSFNIHVSVSLKFFFFYFSLMSCDISNYIVSFTVCIHSWSCK